MIFKDYVGVLEEFPESSLDFILIDGEPDHLVYS
jgi:hypothetical protein